MRVRNEFQKWTTSRIRDISLCGVASILVLGADCLPAHAAGWLSLPAIRKPKEKEKEKEKPKEKEPVAEKPVVDHSNAIFRAMDEAKAADKKGDIDRALIYAERAVRLAESNANEEEPSTRVLVTATATYYQELKTRKSEGNVKKESTAKKPAAETEKKVASKPKVAEEKVSKATPKEEKQAVAKQQPAKAAPKTHRSGKIDERATISKAMDTEMESSGKRPTDTKTELTKSAAMTSALEAPKEQLKPTRRYQKPAAKPATPALSAVAEKPAGSQKDLPVAKAAVVASATEQTRGEASQVEAEFDPFPNDQPKVEPSTKVVTRKQFKDLWDAQDQVEKPKSAEPAWTAETEKANQDDVLAWAEQQDELISRAFEPEEDPQLAEARKSMRIKLRPRQSNEPIQTPANTTETALASASVEPGPQIHPMLRASDSKSGSATVSTTESTTAQSLGEDDSQWSDFSEPYIDPASDRTNQEVLAQLNSTGANSVFDDESSNNDFPSKMVLELKRRLESCEALQPGEIAARPVSNPLTEFFESDEEASSETVVAQSASTLPEATNDASWDDSPSTEVAELAEGTPDRIAEASEPIGEASSKRVVKAEVTARMSLIQWRAASHTDAPASKSSDEVVKSLPDIRESVTPGAQDENDSLFKLPSVSISLKDGAKPVDHPPGPASRTPPLQASAWDNAAVPDDAPHGIVSLGHRAKSENSMNMEIAPPAPVEQISFNGRQHQDRTGSHASDLVTASAIEIPDLDLPSDPSSAFAGSRSDRSDDPTYEESENVVVLNGPIERFAYVCGISTPAAAVCLGGLAVAVLVAGFFALQSAARVALLGRDPA